MRAASSARAGVVHRIGERLRQRDLQQEARQVGERGVEREAARLHLVGDLHRAGRVARGDGLEQPHEVALVDRAEHVADARRADVAAAVRDRLVEQRERVAHAARRGAGEQRKRFGLEC